MSGHVGGCMCGAVRFRADGAPLCVAVCHCGSCRRATGAAFSVFVDLPRGAVVFEGEPAVWRSSPGVERLFCARCGASLAYRGEGSPDELNVHLGAFDTPEAFVPGAVVHEGAGLAWARKMLAELNLETLE